MEFKELAKKIILEHGGIAKSSDFVQSGISAETVVNLCNAKYLERIRHGYYCLVSQESPSEEKMLVKFVPKGILCAESALFHYGYSDFIPRETSLAVPRSISRTKLKAFPFPLKVYYVQENIYELGKTSLKVNGTCLNIYDRERTICDCFKYRSKIDSEIFNKAVKAYANDEDKNLQKLSEYAKKLHVYKKVTNLMEVLLNG